MGTVHKFRRPPKNRDQFRGHRPKRQGPSGKPPRKGLRHWQWNLIGFAALVAIIAVFAGLPSFGSASSGPAFECQSPEIVDGDTLRCGDRRVRLNGIDAPEMPGHCRPGRDCTPGDPYASTNNLRRLVRNSDLQCRASGIDAYGRTIARCSAAGQDLSCAQIKAGHAVRRYAFIWC